MKKIEDYFDEFPKSDWKIEKKIGSTNLPYRKWVAQAVESARGWNLLEEQYEEDDEE